MPLLFETGFDKLTRPTILITCSPAVQLRRLIERNNMTSEDAEARIAAQMPAEQKSKLADVILNNDGTLEELQTKVAVIEQLQLRQGRWLHLILLSPIGVAATLSLLWRFLS